MNKLQKLTAAFSVVVGLLISIPVQAASIDHVQVERIIDVSAQAPNSYLVQAIFIHGADGSVVDEPIIMASTTNPVTATSSAFVSDVMNWAVNYASTVWGQTISPSIVTWDGWGIMNSSQFSQLQTFLTASTTYATLTGTANTYAQLPVASSTTRALNTAFQVSSARPSMVSYGVDVAATISLTTGQTGTVALKYADDQAFTTNVKTVQSSANGNTGSLTIGLNLTQTATASVTGIIPAGKWVELVTTNTTGTPTFTYRTGQETTF